MTTYKAMKKLIEEAYETQQKLWDLAIEWDDACMIFLHSDIPEFKRLALELDEIYGRYIYRIARKMQARWYRRIAKAVEIRSSN